MSRYAERINDNTTVEYGFDDVGIPGYFYSVSRGGELVEAGDTRELMIVEDAEEHMNRSEIAESLREYGVNEDHVEAIMMDQPF